MARLFLPKRFQVVLEERRQRSRKPSCAKPPGTAPGPQSPPTHSDLEAGSGSEYAVKMRDFAADRGGKARETVREAVRKPSREERNSGKTSDDEWPILQRLSPPLPRFARYPKSQQGGGYE